MALLLVTCLLVAGVGAAWLVRNVPGAARLVYGDPASPTSLPTLRPTFTPVIPIATLTPLPTATTNGTPTPVPTVTAPSSPVPTDAGPTPAPTDAASTPAATDADSTPAATDGGATPAPTAVPSATPTPKPPTETPTLSAPSPTPRPQWIVFETERGERGDYEIFVTTPDGSRQRNLTHSWADDLAPVWSPDGQRIAFVSLRETLAGKWGLGPGSIFLMGFDPLTGEGGGGLVRLTDDEGNDAWPTWAPDGQRVAFASDRSGNWDIWAVNVDGSGLVNLTNSPDDEQYPAWSPDGLRMAFTSKRSGSSDVWVMNVEDALQGTGTANAVNLTKSPQRDRYAMWSPDGAKIAFNTSRDGNQEIYVMNADGSDPTNVTNAPDSAEGLADWSPDGRRLALYSDRPGNKDVFVVDLGSGRWTNITNHPASDEFCTWSP